MQPKLIFYRSVHFHSSRQPLFIMIVSGIRLTKVRTGTEHTHERYSDYCRFRFVRSSCTFS